MSTAKQRAATDYTNFYVAGGTLAPDAPSYIERKADNELLERVLAGDFCYLLTTRQMGKSSLMARTANRLKKKGVRSVMIDLSALGGDKDMDADRWYCGIADEVLSQLKIDIDLGQWWEKRKHIPPVKRLMNFFQEATSAPAAGTGPVVIFVDEIDTTINLPFTDDFFAAVRACYNARAAQPEFRSLTFVLLGVAAPTDLIKDASRTPFNIGTRIELTDFTPQEAAPLADGLGTDKDQAKAALKRILYWTGGHPYLTQKICRLSAQGNPDKYSDEYIDKIVEEYFIAPGTANSEDNIQFVVKRMTGDKKRRRPMLVLYRRIRQGKRVLDNTLSPTHTQLKLSGVSVPRQDRSLGVRNKIYDEVFTTRWASQVMPIYWMRNIAAAAVLMLMVSMAYWYWGIFPRQYIDTIQTAREDAPLNAYRRLKRIPFYGKKADKSMAAYWERRALRAEFAGDGDSAILYRLQALASHDTRERRCKIGNLTSVLYKNLRITFRHDAYVNAAAFSPDGRYVVTGTLSYEKKKETAQVWEWQTGQPAGPAMEHDEWIHAVDFSPDGRYLLTNSGSLLGEGTAQVWDWQTGKQHGPAMKHNNVVLAAAFSPDSRYVVTGRGDETARVWDWQTGKPVGMAMKHNNVVYAAAFSPDGRYVATGIGDGTALVWDWQTVKPVGMAMKKEDRVFSAAFSPHGRYVLTGSRDGTAQVWDWQTGKPVESPMIHKDVVFAAAFSPDGRYVLTGSWDNTARVWDWKIGKPVDFYFKNMSIVNAVNFNWDGRYVVTGSEDGTAQVWDWQTGKPVGHAMKHDDEVYTATFSPNSRFVLTGSIYTSQVWDWKTGKEVGTAMKHDNRAIAQVFSPDGRYVAIGSYGGIPQVCDWQTGQSVLSPTDHYYPLYAAAFSPDGRYVLTGNLYGIAQVWEWKTGKPAGLVMKHGSWVKAAAFSHNGRYLLTRSYSEVKLWDWQTGKPDGFAMEHNDRLSAAAFSPDGRSIITATRNWVYRWTFSKHGMIPVAARPLPYSFAGGIQVADHTGNTVRAALYYTGDSITVSTIHFDVSDMTPIQGSPAELLKEWQFKLGLVLNPETGEITKKQY